VGLGIAFDFLLEAAPVMVEHTHGAASWWKIGSAVVLLSLLAWFAVEDARRWVAGRSSAAAPATPGIEIGVAGMTCEGCAGKLETALRREPGVHAVQVLLHQGKAIVHGDVDANRLRRVIEGAGFTPKRGQVSHCSIPGSGRPR